MNVCIGWKSTIYIIKHTGLSSRKLNKGNILWTIESHDRLSLQPANMYLEESSKKDDTVYLNKTIFLSNKYRGIKCTKGPLWGQLWHWNKSTIRNNTPASMMRYITLCASWYKCFKIKSLLETCVGIVIKMYMICIGFRFRWNMGLTDD